MPNRSKLSKLKARAALTITIESREEMTRRMLAAAQARRFDGHRYTFATVEAFSRTLTPARWEIIRAMIGAGPLTLAEIAARIDRDPGDDVKGLLDAGVLDNAGEGKVVLPFEAVHVDFTIGAVT